PNDYKYKGMLLMRTGQDSLALVAFEKAIEMDASIAGDIYSVIGANAFKDKKYDVAIKYYDKKRNGSYQNLNVSDCFDLGKAHYFSAGAKQRALNETKEALAKKKKPTNTPEILATEDELKTSFALADSAF